MKNVIISILAVLVLILGGYLVYDKFIVAEENKEIVESNDDKEEIKDEYTIIDKNNESIKFLYSIRGVNVPLGFDKTLYTTEYLKVEDRTQEDKIKIASIIFGNNQYETYNGTEFIEVIKNEKVKNAYERIFGTKTYSRENKISSNCFIYTYDQENDYYILTDGGCGGAGGTFAEENIDEVRKYNDRIEIKTSYYFCMNDPDVPYLTCYFDADFKQLIGKVNFDETDNVYSQYKDQINHMTYTYKLGEDGFYYYYSSKMNK